MTRVVLSPAALADLGDIWDYTAEHWGVEQADHYVGDIRKACEGLAGGTRISRPVTVRAGYRKSLVGSHTLFFKTNERDEIVIVRVLHQRMDVERHL